MLAQDILDGFEEIQINEIEYGFLCAPVNPPSDLGCGYIFPASESRFRMVFPKLFPLIPARDVDMPTNPLDLGLSDGMFANHISCKPVVQKVIKHTHYIWVKKSDQIGNEYDPHEIHFTEHRYYVMFANGNLKNPIMLTDTFGGENACLGKCGIHPSCGGCCSTHV